MSVTFSLSEFAELVSTALEIDTSLDSKLSTFDSFSPSSSSYSTANAKPSSSLPLTQKSSSNSPRVLRKIRSLLAYGTGRINQSTLPPLPKPSLKSTRSEPLIANSEPSLKPISYVSLLGQKTQLKAEADLFVPYLPLADRHERFGTSSSIFSRHGSDCGSSVVPPNDASESGHYMFSKPLPTPPQSPTHRRASFSSSVCYSQSTEFSASHSDFIDVSKSTTSKSKHSSISSCTTRSSTSLGKSTHPSSKSSMQSHSLDGSDSDPFAKGRVQVVTRRTSAGSSYGGPNIYSSNPVHPFSSSHPAQSIRTVQEVSTDESLEAEYCHFMSPSQVPTSRSSDRRKRVSTKGRPKQKPALTCPFPLPPRSQAPTGPLPPIPINTVCSSSTEDINGLPSPPITPPGSFRESFVLSKIQNYRDWTLGMPYTTDEDISDLKRINRRTGLSRSKEVMPRRRSSRPLRKEDSLVLPHPERSMHILSLAERRTDLKPMGHKRKGSPFPLILTPLPPWPSSDPAADNFCSSSSISPSCHSLMSSTSDSSDPLENVHRRREMMMKEPAGMILGKNGFPVPLSILPTPKLLIVATSTNLEGGSRLTEDSMDAETPMQSPTTPT
ncbi:hypothetical protein J3R30DRAFT_1339456 [Lentinula aciculospora]|uniref:Uncharacterized protein n=1 Tax=Lentinula aciculospora TaxID=153920 RepID=A0A9W9AN09_9AGAR|nr:hypothetical protein J3R30DRAFT_1339456 [Lentinula aciculospora]